MLNIELRSKNFDEVVGHEKIINEFKEYSKDLSYPNYILATGEAGSSKTSSLMIIAKTLNCHNPEIKRNGEKVPCDKCSSCIDVNTQGFHRDIIYEDGNFIDKEYAKKLEDRLSVMTMHDENKILIIDEAHCIASSQAKSTFLTLTDKVRKGVYIFLATTNDKAFDNAFKRRFRKFQFRELPFETISSYLFSLSEKLDPKKEIPETFFTEGIFTIAYNCYGSIGVALDILETCLNRKLYSDEEILEELGIVSLEKEVGILVKLLQKDVTVIEELLKYNLEEFYYRTLKIITSAYIYQKSGYIEVEWKKKNANILKQFNLIELLEWYKSVDKYPYFNKESFIVNLLQYIDTKEPIRRRIKE